VLIVTSKLALEQAYPSSGYGSIRDALNEAASPGDHVLAIDDPVETNAWGLQPVTGGADDIKWAIRQLTQRFPSIVDSVLLAGGNTIIPFFSLANPVTDRSVDPDTFVLTDNPYGSAADSWDEYLAPSLAVARLVVPDSASVAEFVAITQSLSQTTRAGRPGTALFINDDWLSYSERIATELPGPQTWHLVPGYQIGPSLTTDAAYGTLYFNLHGFSGTSDWDGYSTVQRRFIPAVTPAAFDAGNVAGSLAFAECCYGAEVTGRSADDSCALKLVQAGATFIGATGLAFGSYVTSDWMLEDADFLVRAFFQVLNLGYPVGKAMMAARKAYLSDTAEARSGQSWQCKQKTLLQFVLYGSPNRLH
jgi:hypothetical protein